MSQKLAGKVAVITGGSSGIGLATAQRFVNEDAYVFVTGRRQTELDAAVSQIGHNVTGVQGDVSKLADLDRLYATVTKEKGKLDIVFANAGTGAFSPRPDYGGGFRQTVRRERKRTAVHGTEGAAVAARRRIDRAERVHRFDLRTSRLERLQLDKSRSPFVRAYVGRRSERAKDTGERA